MKTKMFFSALAAMLLVTSCAQPSMDSKAKKSSVNAKATNARMVKADGLLTQHPMLAGKVSFKSASIEMKQSSSGVWTAGLSLSINALNTEEMKELLKDVASKYPDDEDLTLTTFYSSFFAGQLNLPTLNNILSGVLAYTTYANPIINGVIYETPNGMVTYKNGSSAIKDDGSIDFNLVIEDRSYNPDPEISKQNIIDGMQSAYFEINQTVVALGAHGQLGYTSGGDYLVNNIDHGQMPGGVWYLDFKNWNGENRTYTAADLKLSDAR